MIDAPVSDPRRDLLRARDAGLLALLALAIGLASIVGRGLTGHDEPRVAGIAREIAIEGNWGVPRLNGAPFLEYPPLGYWPIALALRVAGGASDFAAHLPWALLGIATTLLTAWIGARIGGRKVGIAAGVLFATMAGAVGIHRSLVVDPALLFFVTLALAGYARVATSEDGEIGARRWGSALLGLGIAGGFLSKGLLGIAAPLAAIGAHVLLARDFGVLQRISAAAAIAACALPGLAWAALVAREEGTGVLTEVLRQSVWRFRSETTHHANPWHFYAEPLVDLTAPSSLAVLAAIGRRVGPRRWREGWPSSGDARLPLAWLAAVVVGLSVASAKRSLYLAPIFPAVALLAAIEWEAWRARFALSPWWGRGYVGIAVVTLGVLFATRALPEDRALSPLPAFDVASSAREGRPVVLITPTEGVEGAALYHFGERVAVARDAAAVEKLASGRWLILEEQLNVRRSALSDALGDRIRWFGTYPAPGSTIRVGVIYEHDGETRPR